MSGFELQERLAADGAGIPIIFITAHDDAPTRERSVGQSGWTLLDQRPIGRPDDID